MACFVGKLPHELDVSDFDIEVPDSMSLTDWLVAWLGGWGEDIIDQAEAQAIVLAMDIVGPIKGSHTLRVVEQLLTPEERHTIWCELFDIDR